jgi:hypothetical protein
MSTSHVEERRVCGGTGWIAVNSTRGLRPWDLSNALQTKYFSTALKEREAHWPKGQVVSDLFGRSYRVISGRVRGPGPASC